MRMRMRRRECFGVGCSDARNAVLPVVSANGSLWSCTWSLNIHTLDIRVSIGTCVPDGCCIGVGQVPDGSTW